MKIRSTIVAIGAGILLMAGAIVAHPGYGVAADDTVPDPPANLRVVDLQPEQFTVAWDPVPGAAEYVVQLSGRDPRGNGIGLTATFDAVWESTYQVSVRARVQHTYTAWSEPLTVTTPMPADFELPSAPLNLRVERDRGEITLIRWDRPAHGYSALAYYLYFETPKEPEDLSGLWAITGELTADPSVNPIGAHIYEPGQSMSLWVVARDRKGNTSPPSAPLVLTCCPF
jgi:hypothetical protein